MCKLDPNLHLRYNAPKTFKGPWLEKASQSNSQHAGQKKRPGQKSLPDL